MLGFLLKTGHIAVRKRVIIVFMTVNVHNNFDFELKDILPMLLFDLTKGYLCYKHTTLNFPY